MVESGAGGGCFAVRRLVGANDFAIAHVVQSVEPLFRTIVKGHNDVFVRVVATTVVLKDHAVFAWT